ncbi:MAG: enoyl-CoA hydratase/isomerase family protein [Gammaproteobacteria bacterium HGW-Gammaproteobacteria-8]|nr:MAG: enoyl-CoA hydratase/isomerase family protein [Gammaproteobacteria bacterium HGW-Gammaproteobacteria-8]
MNPMLEVVEHQDRIRELKLARPPVNALNPALIDALSEAVAGAPGDGVQALVLSGRPGLFSAGLDVPELLALDRAGMIKFWQALLGLLEDLARSPIPVVAAFTGHSPAGGTVLGLYCDYRVMAEGDFQLGLNEVQVGLVIPPVIHRALARLIGIYPAERHLVAGRMIPAARALKIGLVDELRAPEDVVERALEWCREHLAMPQHALLATRALCRADLCALFDAPDAMNNEAFADVWFSPETQATLQAMVERIRNK